MTLEKVYDELYGMIEDLQKKVARDHAQDVEITPTFQSGTKLADYEINGTEGAIYAPDTETVTIGHLVASGNAFENGTLGFEECYKKDGVAYLAGRIHTMAETTPASGEYFTVPEGFRPSVSVYGMAGMNVLGSTEPAKATATYCRVDSDGKVIISFSSSAKCSQVIFAISYPIDIPTTLGNTRTKTTKKK